MYKRIAVAIDGSETSSKALNEAIKLSGEMGATLLLLHVFEDLPIIWEPDGMYGVPIQNMMQVVEDAGKSMLDKYREQVARQNISVETKLVNAEGDRLGGVISEEALKWAADLLVVGTHGRKGFEHLLMGSVAEGVIRTASMPVLLVRANK